MRHAASAAAEASRNCAAGSGPRVNALGGEPAAAAPRAGDHPDHVVEEVVHGPLLARRLVVVLLGPDAGDDGVGVLEGLVERVDEVHADSILCKMLLTHSRRSTRNATAA